MVLPATYRWKSGDASFGEAAGFTHDISIGGMFIVADRLPPGDTDVWCEVVLPQSFDRGVMRKLRVAGPVEIREFSGVEEHPSGFAVRGRPALLTEEGKPEDWERLLTGVLK